MVTFQDQHGRERWDCVMMDFGASAFLMGYGPFLRCISHVEEHGFNETLKFVKCDRKFFFGGDASSHCKWTVMTQLSSLWQKWFHPGLPLARRDTDAHGQADHGGHWPCLGLQRTKSQDRKWAVRRDYCGCQRRVPPCPTRVQRPHL